MPTTVKNTEHAATSVQEMPALKPWQRQKGESVAWHTRFMRYVRLGPKRTLLAASDQERQTMRTLEDTHKRAPAALVRKKSEKLTLVDVPKPQAPSSWKRASSQWNWIERAQAYDADLIDRIVEKNMGAILSMNYSNTLGRVKGLHGLYESTATIFNANNATMSLEQANMCLSRLQSILKDIREEMKNYDESLARLALHTRYAKEYNALSTEDMPKQK